MLAFAMQSFFGSIAVSDIGVFLEVLGILIAIRRLELYARLAPEESDLIKEERWANRKYWVATACVVVGAVLQLTILQ
ncbi:MAG: hypothetical protein H6922_01800 [Pseudomonadaceae bacterium]|nr:hypothetical protein [Pseudomonadaceae bacterium]